MIRVTEHNHSGYELSFEDLYLMALYSEAVKVHHEHLDYFRGRTYGLSEEDASWWSTAGFSIRWSDIHADSYGVGLGILLELGNYKYPILASKIITQHLTSQWSLKRVAIFLIEKAHELNEFVTEAHERRYPWGYIKSILDEYAEIHSEYWIGTTSITSFCELTYYRPHTVISDSNELDTLCQQAIDNNAKSVEDYRKGKTAAIKHLIGQVMKLSKGKADVKLVTETLERKLKI